MHKVNWLNEKNLRGHIKSLQDDEKLKVSDLKILGHSCLDCSLARASSFSLICTKDQRHKFVKTYNICSHWQPITGLNTDEDS
jgi:hypothetical protein